jgi:hypothetical protein
MCFFPIHILLIFISLKVEANSLISNFSPLIEVLINARGVLEGSKNKQEIFIGLLCTLAPLFLERCNYNAMIEYVTIRKLKG